jgi:hypothetical protein
MARYGFGRYRIGHDDDGREWFYVGYLEPPPFREDVAAWIRQKFTEASAAFGPVAFVAKHLQAETLKNGV